VSAFTVAFPGANVVATVSDFAGFAADTPAEGTWARQVEPDKNAHTPAKRATTTTELIANLIDGNYLGPHRRLGKFTPDRCTGSRTVSRRTSVLHPRLGRPQPGA